MRYGSIFLIKMLDIPNICFYNKHMFELYSDLTTMEKLEILADAAKYDVACSLGTAWHAVYVIVLVLMAGAFRF